MGRKLRFFIMAVAFLLIIPASTAVTDFGWTDLTCNLKDEWNNVNDGEYSDVLTFSAKLTNA